MTHHNNRSVTDSLPDRPPIGSDPSGHRSHGRTDGLTKKNSPSDSVSPNASPANSPTIPPISTWKICSRTPVDDPATCGTTCDCPALEDHPTTFGHLTTPRQADTAEERTTDVRPVVPVVARVLDLDELDRFVAAGEWLPPGDVRPLVAEVRRLREVVSGWAANLGSASGRISELETELDADRKAIGVLGAAVGKVSELHRDDGDGFCTACRTTAWPCATAAAIGVGQ